MQVASCSLPKVLTNFISSIIISPTPGSASLRPRKSLHQLEFQIAALAVNNYRFSRLRYPKFLRSDGPEVDPDDLRERGGRPLTPGPLAWAH